LADTYRLAFRNFHSIIYPSRNCGNFYFIILFLLTNSRFLFSQWAVKFQNMLTSAQFSVITKYFFHKTGLLASFHYQNKTLIITVYQTKKT